MKFNGNPQQLGFFLAPRVWFRNNYRKWQNEVCHHGSGRCCSTVDDLSHNDDASKLRYFNRFMAALPSDSRTPWLTADCKARDCIKTISQGLKGVAK